MIRKAPTQSCEGAFCCGSDDPAVFRGHPADAPSDHHACHPFSAVATYGQVVPGASWVMWPYVRPFPSRMLTLPPSETMTTVPETGGFPHPGAPAVQAGCPFPHPLRRPSARHGFFLRTCRPPPAPRRPERRGVPPRFPRQNSRPRRSGEAHTPATEAFPAGRARRFLPSRPAADGSPAGFPRASHRPCFPANPVAIVEEGQTVPARPAAPGDLRLTQPSAKLFHSTTSPFPT